MLIRSADQKEKNSLPYAYELHRSAHFIINDDQAGFASTFQDIKTQTFSEGVIQNAVQGEER